MLYSNFKFMFGQETSGKRTLISVTALTLLPSPSFKWPTVTYYMTGWHPCWRLNWHYILEIGILSWNHDKLYWCPVSAKTSCHKLHGLKQQKFILSQSGIQESKIQVSAGPHPSWISGGGGGGSVGPSHLFRPLPAPGIANSPRQSLAWRLGPPVTWQPSPPCVFTLFSSACLSGSKFPLFIKTSVLRIRGTPMTSTW